MPQLLWKLPCSSCKGWCVSSIFLFDSTPL